MLRAKFFRSILFASSFAVANAVVAAASLPSPEKTVYYWLVPAVTGNRADSHFQFTFSKGVKEEKVPHSRKMPRGARILAVTANDAQPASVWVKVTNVANSEFNAICLLNLSTQRWERAAQQPVNADCGNFPLSGTVDSAEKYTVIGVSTPNTKPTPPAGGKEFRVPSVTVNVVGDNLSAHWTVIHTFKDSDVSYKVTLYDTAWNQPIQGKVMNATTWTFTNLPDGQYKVRIAAQDTKGRKAGPSYTDSVEIHIPLLPPFLMQSGYYLIMPSYHNNKPDDLHVLGTELASLLTPLPPGAVLISIPTTQPKKVQITVFNTTPLDTAKSAPTATCTLMMSAKNWSIAENEKDNSGCVYFPQKGGIAGTLEVPTVIKVSTPK
jgi:hypothetical protein